MHATARTNCKLFFDTYLEFIPAQTSGRVLEVGSQDVNGSLRSVSPPGIDYIGVDFVEGQGVDVVIEDPYVLPFESGSIDVVLSSSCFEHSEMFWIIFLEILRVLKPTGLFYLNAPSNGAFHRDPVDCWRFYPDSGRALVKWAHRTGVNAGLLESYISNQQVDIWNDFVGVFLKDQNFVSLYPARIVDKFQGFQNGLKFGSENFLNPSTYPEDLLKPQLMKPLGRLAKSLLRRAAGLTLRQP